MNCSRGCRGGWNGKESTASERGEGGWACWCHQWSEVASVCVFSMLLAWRKGPLAAEIFLMHPDGNFAKSSYCGALHFLVPLLEPGSLAVLAVEIGSQRYRRISDTTGACVLCSLNNWWNMYLSPSGLVRSPLGLRQLLCKPNPSPTCLSVLLSVVSVAQPHRQGKRSSTFTLPPCQTSRGVLMNEVAISYCSVKHVCMRLCVPDGKEER